MRAKFGRSPTVVSKKGSLNLKVDCLFFHLFLVLLVLLPLADREKKARRDEEKKKFSLQTFLTFGKKKGDRVVKKLSIKDIETDIESRTEGMYLQYHQVKCHFRSQQYTCICLNIFQRFLFINSSMFCKSPEKLIKIVHIVLLCFPLLNQHLV